MKDEMISRQAAIEAMRKAKDKSEAHRMLVQLPSAQPTCTVFVPVDDCISRQAALDAVDLECEEFRGIFGRIEKRIKALPPAQPGWIPCSCELPKKDGDYLVTTHSGQIARYIFIGGSSEEYWRRCATAWMPLPKPWEGEKP